MINEKKKKKIRGPVVFVINEKKKKIRGPVVFVINEKKRRKKKNLEGRSSLSSMKKKTKKKKT